MRGDDSSDSVLRGKSMLECEVGEILRDISDTLGMHVNAAQALLPLLVPSAARGQGNSPSYTLVTGGFENQFFESQLQAEVFTLTSLHGLSVALRNAKSRLPVRINEIDCLGTFDDMIPATNEVIRSVKQSPSRRKSPPTSAIGQKQFWKI